MLKIKVLILSTEEQRRATRRQIQKAIDMKDSEMLERYIQQYEKLNPPFDDELLQKARRTLNALDAKEGKLFCDNFLYILSKYTLLTQCVFLLNFLMNVKLQVKLALCRSVHM